MNNRVEEFLHSEVIKAAAKAAEEAGLTRFECVCGHRIWGDGEEYGGPAQAVCRNCMGAFVKKAQARLAARHP